MRWDALIQGLAADTKAYLAPFLATLDSIGTRVADLEQRAPVAGKDGRDGVDGQPGAEGPVGPQGPPGPAGADGQSITGPQGEKGIDGLHGDAGPQGTAGRDGADGAVGPHGAKGLDGLHGSAGLDGKDGAPGAAGLPGRDGLSGRDGLPGIAGEKGLDGKDGRDGLDGFGFDDLSVTHDGERTFTIRFVKGDREKTFPFTMDAMIFRGVYADGQAYAKGDVTQFGGNMYVAKTATTMKPSEIGEGQKHWTLAVRRGRDGKPGERK